MSELEPDGRAILAKFTMKLAEAGEDPETLAAVLRVMSDEAGQHQRIANGLWELHKVIRETLPAPARDHQEEAQR